MSKFKIGDIIVGEESSNIYSWTCKKSNFVGQVLDLYGEGTIAVKVIESDHTIIGKVFSCVNSEHFKLKEKRKKINKKLLQKGDKIFGTETQIRLAIEEMAELTVELAKLDNPHKSTNTGNIAPEIADVIIMMEQLVVSLGIDDIDEQIMLKMSKYKERVQGKLFSK